MPPDEEETERLRLQQAEKAERERQLIERSADEAERDIHERRSDKAAYLEEKLEEQKQAPDEPDSAG
jgi:hypothetical protein